MTYRITVRKGERDICFIHLMDFSAIKTTLAELRTQYPRCVFVLQSISKDLTVQPATAHGFL